MMLRIEAPHFVGGLIIEGESGLVLDAPPIVRYMKGWTVNKVRNYCERKGWYCTEYPDYDEVFGA